MVPVLKMSLFFEYVREAVPAPHLRAPFARQCSQLSDRWEPRKGNQRKTHVLKTGQPSSRFKISLFNLKDFIFDILKMLG